MCRIMWDEGWTGLPGSPDQPTEFSCYFTYLLIPWSRALFEKLTGFQLVKKFPAFYGNHKLAPRLQEPAICPYPKPDQSSS